jgi:hypothetical protein
MFINCKFNIIWKERQRQYFIKLSNENLQSRRLLVEFHFS